MRKFVKMTEQVQLNFMERFIRKHVQHYDAHKYWSRRATVINPTHYLPKFWLYYLYYIKNVMLTMPRQVLIWDMVRSLGLFKSTSWFVWYCYFIMQNW